MRSPSPMSMARRITSMMRAGSFSQPLLWTLHRWALDRNCRACKTPHSPSRLISGCSQVKDSRVSSFYGRERHVKVVAQVQTCQTPPFGCRLGWSCVRLRTAERTAAISHSRRCGGNWSGPAAPSARAAAPRPARPACPSAFQLLLELGSVESAGGKTSGLCSKRNHKSCSFYVPVWGLKSTCNPFTTVKLKKPMTE